MAETITQITQPPEFIEAAASPNYYRITTSCRWF
ncbi:MAG: hypothetical protein CM15mV60_240 [uncultured marine virus]|nr:MAG: hypothetical protein CM15mV60_240 [uncultured marine virus]